MFIKLFAINIVASNLLGNCLSFSMALLVALSSVFNLSKSCGASEKKATSEPDTKADDASNSIRMSELKPIRNGEILRMK